MQLNIDSNNDQEDVDYIDSNNDQEDVDYNTAYDCPWLQTQ